jgi:arylmalonate decarboxylase
MKTGNTKPVLGIIVPPAAGKVPPELPQLYGEELSFISQGLGVPDMSNDAFDRVVAALAGVSRSLAANGAQAIALMGTSLSFYRGKKFNDELTTTLRQAGGVPATTMSSAIVAALHAVGAKRLAVGTAYNLKCSVWRRSTS